MRPSDVFALVKETGIRSLEQLRDRACSSAGMGDTRLAEFCTIHKPDDLQRYLNSAWAVHDAPQRSLQMGSTRLQKLRAFAAMGDCVRNGVWIPLVLYILQYHNENIPTFCSDILRALQLGAARGVNIAIVGPPGCGKSS